MRIQLNDSRREDGAVAVMVALFAVILIVVAAFTTDFGMAYAQGRALSTGADSAALAVAHTKYLSAMANPKLTCSDLKVLSAADEALARAQVRANKPFNEVIQDADVATTLDCVGTSSGTLQVTVAVNHTSGPILGGVLGASPMNVGRQAVAIMGVGNQVGGLEPLALCTDQAKAIIASVTVGTPPTYPVQKVSLSKVWGGTSLCGDSAGGAGNWGWLQFPGQGTGEKELGDMITSGYSGTLTLDTSATPPSYTIGGTPGNKANGTPVQNGLKAIMDTPVTFPIYGSGTIDKSGNNATYKVIGFLSVKVCGYNSGSKLVQGACYDSSPALALTGDDMQVQYVNYIDADKIKLTCAIGDPTCAFNSYMTTLVG